MRLLQKAIVCACKANPLSAAFIFLFSARPLIFLIPGASTFSYVLCAPLKSGSTPLVLSISGSCRGKIKNLTARIGSLAAVRTLSGALYRSSTCPPFEPCPEHISRSPPGRRSPLPWGIVVITAHVFVPDPRPPFCFWDVAFGISLGLSDLHHTERHPIPSFFLSSQL